jgi:hypothetical protein
MAVVMAARFSVIADDAKSAEARNARYEQLQEQIGDYYSVESPWTGPDAELEGTLFRLMGAEVGIWQLRDNLKDRNDANYSTASFVATRLHEEVLCTGERALSIFRARPNPRLLKLFIAHLEAYPYSWSQEGSEDLLPNLKKLLNTGNK